MSFSTPSMRSRARLLSEHEPAFLKKPQKTLEKASGSCIEDPNYMLASCVACHNRYAMIHAHSQPELRLLPGKLYHMGTVYIAMAMDVLPPMRE